MLSTRTQLGASGGWKGAKLLSPVSLTDEGWDPLLEIYNGQLWDDDGSQPTYISYRLGQLQQGVRPR